ncbi:hypothetical protein EVAR_59111_1 [Eumeta japonica]|uniref:Uncharacterized protein n=1 Tax=Eumeta variegata TaxID=151549 RepID=A0A4C1YVV7_EUMVA|nr:hypothetical protein EVAR_59111_1 [Eumeta japonica]
MHTPAHTHTHTHTYSEAGEGGVDAYAGLNVNSIGLRERGARARAVPSRGAGSRLTRFFSFFVFGGSIRGDRDGATS